MISIDRVYKTVLFFVNSDVRGNVKPDELRLAINNAVNEIIEDYFVEVNKAVNRENRGLVNSGLENIPERIREKITHFLKEELLTHDNGLFSIPSDCRYLDSVYYLETEIEPCKNAKEFKIISNVQDSRPTESYPIYLKIEDKIKVAPDTIVDEVSAWYLRKHKIAKWTFVVIGGSEVYNPSAPDFQDIDLHASEESKVILKTLQYFGVNLHEDQLVAYTRGEEALKTNEENTL